MSSTNGHLLNHLPAIYHESEDLVVLLAVFEKILYGEDGQDQRQKESRQSLDKLIPVVDSIATISLLFDPYKTPKDFVPWLTQWVALVYLEGLDNEQKKHLIARIVPLYAIRGTKKYIKEFVEFFIPQKLTVAIQELGLAGFVIGTAHVAEDTWLERERPFWFKVKIIATALKKTSDQQSEFVALWEKRIRRVVDLAKPAHTLYELDWQFEANETKTVSTGSVVK